MPGMMARWVLAKASVWGWCFACALACVMGVVGCEDRPVPQGPTPIEQLLAADSAYRAVSGDSSNRHIVSDYANLNRAAWQKPEVLLDRLGDLSEKTVVEVGAGTGFFTRRLARRAARVIALDIDPEMLLLLDSLNAAQLDAAAYARIDPRLVPASDPALGVEEADAALVVNTFMYIQEGPTYLRRLAAGLRPGSPVLVVDFKQEPTPVGPPVGARRPLAEVEAAMRAAGLQAVTSDEETLDFQYVVVGVVR